MVSIIFMTSSIEFKIDKLSILVVHYIIFIDIDLLIFLRFECSSTIRSNSSLLLSHHSRYIQAKQLLEIIHYKIAIYSIQ